MGGWFGLKMIRAVTKGKVGMTESGAWTLLDRFSITYSEPEVASEALFNATLMWVPISSIMWAGIIYTVFWLIH